MKEHDRKVLFSSNKNDWSTPDSLFKGLSNYFGGFTLDTCATIENTKCTKYFSEKENGLIQSWVGEVTFTNPPYSDIATWVKKNYEESRKCNKVKVMLIPARTDTRYVGEYITKASNIFFIQGRLKFSGSKNSAPFPSMIVVFDRCREGERSVRWCNREFTKFW
jgi:site-specific DNA-methyltransferase (adenine-specific)